MTKLVCNFGDLNGEQYFWISLKKCNSEINGEFLRCTKAKSVASLTEWSCGRTDPASVAVVRTACENSDESVEFYRRFVGTIFGVRNDMLEAGSSVDFCELKEIALEQLNAFENPEIPVFSQTVLDMILGCEVRAGRSHLNCYFRPDFSVVDKHERALMLSKWFASVSKACAGEVQLKLWTIDKVSDHAMLVEYTGAQLSAGVLSDEFKAYASVLSDDARRYVPAERANERHAKAAAKALAAAEKQREKDRKLLEKLTAENKKLKGAV